MTQDVLAFDHLRQLDKLKEIVGGLDECGVASENGK